eukprot:SM000172S03059  [mRNA]  locus=s172:147863:149668:+ [translate_table: standard]
MHGHWDNSSIPEASDGPWTPRLYAMLRMRLKRQTSSLLRPAPSVPVLAVESDSSKHECVAVPQGCWQLAGGHRGDPATDETNGEAAVRDFQPFVNAGISTFDTADIYGASQSLIGQYLKGSSRLPVVFTKFCVFGAAQGSITKDYVRKSIDKSMRELGVMKLDLVQVYWNDYAVRNYVQAARYLAELQEEGKISYIGVTNFDNKRIKELLDAGVRIVSSQVQYSLLDRRPENGHIEFCRAHGISVLPFGAVAGGFLSDKFAAQSIRPPLSIFLQESLCEFCLGFSVSVKLELLRLCAGMSYDVARQEVRLDTYSKSKYFLVLNQSLLDVLKPIANKHGTSIANIATKWVLTRPQVAAVIVGARNARHVADHQKLFTFELDESDLGRIESVLRDCPRPKGDIYTWERGGQF